MLIHVRRAWSQDGEEVGLKTKTSGRIAVMEQPYAGRVAELVSEGDGEWLMDDGTGQPMRRRTASAAWKRFVESSGLPKITMSRLRNSYETYMHWERGISQQSLSKILGHSDIETTRTYYDLPDNQKVANVFIEELEGRMKDFS